MALLQRSTERWQKLHAFCSKRKLVNIKSDRESGSNTVLLVVGSGVAISVSLRDLTVIVT